MRAALDQARAAGASGEVPVGAAIVKDGVVIAAAHNAPRGTHDPTAHAEIMAIRAACRELGTFDLSGATLYTSCEPCPMCLSASLWARLDAVWFAADRHDAAAGGFDDAEFYEYFATPEHERSLPVRPVALAERTAPFEAWARNVARTAY